MNIQDWLVDNDINFDTYTELYEKWYIINLLVAKSNSMWILISTWIRPKWFVFPYLNPILPILSVVVWIYFEIPIINIILGVVAIILSWFLSLPSFTSIWNLFILLLIFLLFQNYLNYNLMYILYFFAIIVFFNQRFAWHLAPMIILDKAKNNEDFFNKLFKAGWLFIVDSEWQKYNSFMINCLRKNYE